MNGPIKHDPLKAVFMLLMATVFWGFSFPLMKAVMIATERAVPGASEWFLAAQAMAMRFGIAALVMLAISGRSLSKLKLLDVKLGVGLGVCAGVGTLLQMAGLKHTLASTSAFLTQFYVLAIPVVLAVYRRRLPSVFVWVSCALVIYGMGILCGVDWRHFKLGRGEWLTLGSSLFFTAQILWLDRKCFAPANKWLATLVLFVTIAVSFFPTALLTANHPRDLVAVNASASTLTMLVLLGLVPGLAAFWLMNSWQPQIHPTHAGLVYCVEPIFASLYALYLPGLLGSLGGFTYANEQLTGNLWIGGALITVANVLIQIAPREQ